MGLASTELLICSDCGSAFSISEKAHKSARCRECRNKRQYDWRAKNRLHYLETRRERRKLHPDKPHHQEQPYNEGKRARRLVAYRIRTGKLVRLPCEKCGNLNTHAHHDSYSRPLEVHWLCPLHHKERHLILEDL